MAKIKFTKGELKRQRDALKRFQRYLPTLQLKKQQLQTEILAQLSVLDEKKKAQGAKKRSIVSWAGLFRETTVDLAPWITPQEIKTSTRNIAGVDIPVFEDVTFPAADYDLFVTPLWVDHALDALRALQKLTFEVSTVEKGIEVLRHELRITTQRVNLFEKVKIPETEENIRLIKIYIGDQMTNAVGRSKIAKRKIEEAVFAEVAS